MRNNDENLREMFNELKKEHENFKKEQRKLVGKLNNKVETESKKYKRVVIYVILICLIFTGISNVASYSIGANSVGYTPKDSGWFVDNTQEAIDDLFDSVGAALVGSVYSYMGVNVPTGYLACDGSTYKITDYPRLANHIKSNFGSFNYFGGDGETTFAVPDLRGEFLRGTGNNSHTNQGSGANVGTHQDATEHINVHVNTSAIYIRQNSRTPRSVSKADSFTPSLSTPYWAEGSNAGTYSTSSSLYYMSRPTNTSVLYIIKY